MSEGSQHRDRQRYLDAAHAMLTGVGYEQALDPKDAEPKQLRTGVNARIIDLAGLTSLLTDKGVLTDGELRAEAVTGSAGDPQSLRAAINTTASDQGALAAMLISKGVFTVEEYVKAVADAMEEEVSAYEARLSSHYGRKITLR